MASHMLYQAPIYWARFAGQALPAVPQDSLTHGMIEGGRSMKKLLCLALALLLTLSLAGACAEPRTVTFWH